MELKKILYPYNNKTLGKFIPKLAEGDKPNQGEINFILYSEPEGLNTNKELPKVEKSALKRGLLLMARKTIIENCDVLVVVAEWQELELLLRLDIGKRFKNNLC